VFAAPDEAPAENEGSTARAELRKRAKALAGADDGLSANVFQASGKKSRHISPNQNTTVGSGSVPPNSAESRPSRPAAPSTGRLPRARRARLRTRTGPSRAGRAGTRRRTRAGTPRASSAPRPPSGPWTRPRTPTLARVSARARGGSGRRGARARERTGPAARERGDGEPPERLEEVVWERDEVKAVPARDRAYGTRVSGSTRVRASEKRDTYASASPPGEERASLGAS
jgi:hypothetical protein